MHGRGLGQGVRVATQPPGCPRACASCPSCPSCPPYRRPGAHAAEPGRPAGLPCSDRVLGCGPHPYGLPGSNDSSCWRRRLRRERAAGGCSGVGSAWALAAWGLVCTAAACPRCATGCCSVGLACLPLPIRVAALHKTPMFTRRPNQRAFKQVRVAGMASGKRRQVLERGRYAGWAACDGFCAGWRGGRPENPGPRLCAGPGRGWLFVSKLTQNCGLMKAKASKGIHKGS